MRRSAGLVAVAVAAVGLAGPLASAAGAAGSSLVVDRADPSCSSSGPVYCTIGQAARVAKAGQAVVVSPGTYPGDVSVANSGMSGAPIVFVPKSAGTVTVSGGTNGFKLSGKQWVTIKGFAVSGTTGDGIYLTGASNVTVTGNHVSKAGRQSGGAIARGIRVNNSTDVTVSANVVDHNTDAGIYLTGTSTRVQAVGNEAFANARGYERAAPGIDVRAPGNTVANNVVHDNEDSGLQFYPGASDTLVADNVAYRNGDHGIDNLGAPRQRIIGNSVYKNVTAGINLEGSSSGGTLANNISVDNGIASPRTSSDIRVDATSVSGARLNRDMVFLHSGKVLFIWGSSSYATLSAFQQATRQEADGLQADPAWRAPDNGDLHLSSGSRAIDSADSAVSGQPVTDAEGKPRVDDPAVANTGAGPRSYDDRGAYEHQPGT